MTPRDPGSENATIGATPVAKRLGATPRPGVGHGRFMKVWERSGQVGLILTALLVGLATGLGAVGFRYLIDAVAWVGFDFIPRVTAAWGRAYVICVPAVGGLIVGVLVHRFAREAKGHGVPEVMAAGALRDGRIRPVVAIVKSIASSVCIGSGGSVGREGPIVQIGSGIGSTVAQLLRLSGDRTVNLVACGAAGGIAATFNAPIGGSVFALEVILGGRFEVRYFSSVVVSAVAASVVGRVAFGDFPAFVLPVEYGVNSLWEFLIYPLLGVAAGLAGVAFVRMLYGSEDLFDAWGGAPEWLKPAIGGALLGSVALGYPALTGVGWSRIPQVFGVGYEVIGQALSNELLPAALLVLFFVKLLATSLTLGSGGSGGVFAPSLFMGATLGGAFENVAHRLLPGITAPSGAYALVGMAAVFSAATHAPITAVLILFEMTGDYRIILPLMLTVAVSTLLGQWLLAGESIYTLKLTRRGVRLERGRDVDLLRSVRVEEVMNRPETVSTRTTIAELAEAFQRIRQRSVLVVDEEGMLWGIVTDGDLERAVEEESPDDIAVTEIGSTWPELVCAHPEETIGETLARMAPRGYESLPVVSSEDPRQLLGHIRRREIIRAYDLALTRRTEIQQRTERIRLDRSAGATSFHEITLEQGDVAVGKSVQQMMKTIPVDCVLVSLQRATRIVIPHGDTVFRTGDRVTAFAHRDDAEKLREWLRRGGGSETLV